MHIKSILAAAALALAAGASQASVTIFTSAFLAPLPGGPDAGVGLNGFGRNTSLASAGIASPDGAPTLVPYFDTWNLGTAGVTPGIYTFSNLLVEAAVGTVFTGITFNSIDATGTRNTFLFGLNASGTEALGSGSFTVLAECPITNCVWIDVIGLRPVGSPWGYGGTGTALPIPEPGAWALMLLGLAGLGVAARRRAA